MSRYSKLTIVIMLLIFIAPVYAQIAVLENTTNNLTIQTNSAPRLLIDSQGRVGIGNISGVSATTRLLVNGTGTEQLISNINAGGDAVLNLQSSASTDPYVRFQPGTGSFWSLGTDASDSSKFKLSQSSALGSSDTIIVTTGGLVGIGGSPTAKFQVAGSTVNTGFSNVLASVSGIETGYLSGLGIIRVGNSGGPGPDPLSLQALGIALSTGSSGTFTDRLVVNSTGYVGIGTTNPLAELHVVDSINAATNPRGILIAQHSANSFGSVLNLRKSRGNETSPTTVSSGDDIGLIAAEAYNGSTYLAPASIRFQAESAPGATAPTRISFYTGGSGYGTEKMRIDNNGNLNITNGGNISLNQSFPYILGSAYGAGLPNTSYIRLTGHSTGRLIINSPMGMINWINANNSANTSSVSLDSWSIFNGTGQAVLLTVDAYSGNATLSTGSLGIGTGSATNTNKLVVLGGGGSNIDLNVTGRILSGDSNNLGGIWVNSAQTMFFGQQATNTMGIYGNGWRLIVDSSNGNVGIGTTAPDTLLHVYGGATSDITMTLGNSSTNGPGLNIGYAGASFGAGTSYINARDKINKNPAFHIMINDSIRMTFLSSGNIGINTTSPQATLQVNGSVQIANGSGAPGNATGSGDIWAASDIEYEGNLYGPGADLAELINASEALEAGDVVVADEMRSESVKRSSQPYSTAVVGVVSSDPGIILSKSKGDVPLALSGRVPIKVSTENGAIKPGDLLTTSSTPGHAMRCESREACSGAIVAKSLGSLNEGTGTIIGLVVLG